MGGGLAMRRSMLVLGVLMLMLLQSVPAESESLIQLKLEDTLEDNDLGLHAGALSPDGLWVLIAGEDGYARLLSADDAGDRSGDVELNSGRNQAFQDLAWHPRGNTALMAGDFGMAMRYDSEDYSIGPVNGTGAIFGLDLTSVEWRPAGDYAYFGAVDGSIWQFSEGTGFIQLEGTRTSEITDIACHRQENICIVATLSNGLAVISQTHEVTYLSGTSPQTWIGVDCADPTLNECVGFASGLKTQAIRLDIVDPSQSTTENLMQFGTLSGDFTTVSRGYDGSTLIHMAPFATVRQQPLISEAYVQIVAEDAAAWDPAVSSRSIAFVWENDQREGFIITSFGNIVSFMPEPPVEVDNSIMTVAVLAAVVVAVPGTILGLIYMNSKTLQGWYMAWRKRSRS
ncbi:MAG TPA: WD40 repeat domain-containing protein [Candidatus Poseidoniales archaeon]|nr:MAG TPA: WD40 repeat domain-containing protein [Candidatus Poseidoniales archaeon]